MRFLADESCDYRVVKALLTGPAEGLYTVLLRRGASPTVDGEATAGPYANPAIGAFGPPRS